MSETAQTLTVYITCADAARAIDHYKQVFGAVETMRLAMPDGKIGHAELRIGNSKLMLSDEFPEINVRSPLAIGGTPVALCLEVDDTDRVVAKAVEAGAKVARPPTDQFYGYRSAKIADPFGHVWDIMTNKEHLSDDEIRRRFEAMTQQSDLAVTTPSA
ncbi:MAG TPA: VOC family protein [Alphaproteobacteria bacterium]|nr:VOC family protein [Alphaproteobacteria bacterium]